MNLNNVERLIFRISSRLTRDYHLREDLSQEMKLSLWLCPEDTCDKEAIKQAHNAARRYMRKFYK